MSIHHAANKKLLDLANYSLSQRERRIAEELLLSLDLGWPHAEDLAEANAASIERCPEQTLLTTGATTIESSQPWLGYW
ncbi:hypothetical protein FB478_11414 [Arthrobacter sp. AG367]|uniref:hypothetical protein n=1 Tax=Arthrobacter sp. AG367 TaxID=2572909 RepID=UPI0011A78918|nr:hypothetical protein [Arthrobacter sp. AG367]TWD47058.1 hypothetical protein FB478_11414 [Arthrobacter sp. AG367]